ncbi:MAG: M23 family metallopeptidase [Deltaproteobacteria bacterium]|nr:M23 family metallopeptidase [Deltaproteobacteria bacterium]
MNNMVLVIAIALSGCHGHEAAAPPEPDATAGADGPAVDATVLPTCACPLGDGTYCATAVAAYETAHGCTVDALAGHEGDVLRCTAGAWTVEATCANGCYVAPDGTPDGCKATAASYHLPWMCGVTYPVTQGNHGDICGSNGGDHTGTQDYAWDFGIPRHTELRATRAGTVTLAANVVGPGQNCYDGCTQPFGTTEFWQCCNACINTSNHVNVAHGDGTVATYWHMDEVTVHTGQVVQQGDVLGYSGTSGCSSGPHLHFQVMGDCPGGYCQSVPIDFDEAGAPACGDNVTSRNACP